MKGKRCVITGGARGMGRITAEAVAAQGAEVLLLDWQGEEGVRARDAINQRHGAGRAQFIYCDLSSLTQVRAVAQRLLDEGRAIDVLLCNAGITYPEFRLSEDGHEFHFAICHLAHYLLCRTLMPALEKSADPRIVLVSSEGHKACKAIDFDDLNGRRYWAGQPFSHAAGFGAYGHAKLCNLLTMRELHTRLRAAGSRISVNAVSPGYFVNTGIHREMRGVFKWGSSLVFGLGSLLGLSTPQKGARCHLYACTAPELAGRSGLYLQACREQPMSPLVDDAALRSRLWDVSAQRVGHPP